MFVRLSLQWERQPPPGISFDRTLPLASAITCFSVPLAKTMYDFVSNSFWTDSYADGTDNSGFDVYGRAVINANAGSDRFLYSPRTDTQCIGTDKGAALIVFRKEDSTDRIGALISANRPHLVGSGDRFLIHAPYSDGTTYFDFGGTAGANRVTAAGLSTEYQRPSTILISGGATGLRIVLNGRVVASSSSAATRGNSGANFALLDTILDRAGLVVIWNAEVPENLACQWTLNPWQLFEPIEFAGFAVVPVSNGADVLRVLTTGMRW